MKYTLLFITIILSFLSLPAQAQERPPAILTFEATEDVIVTVNEAEQRSLTTALSWEVINFTDEYELALDAYAVNDWLTLYEDITLRPVEMVNVPLIHPLNFGPITYRLSILNSTGILVDQRFVHIDFTVEDEQPTISLFEAYDTSPYDGFRMNVELGWEVMNRRPNTNIEFDQILPNGQIQPIELPRLSLWVSSAGNGRVRPFYADGSDSLLIRMRIVDMLDGTVYDSAETTVSAAQVPDVSAGSSEPVIVTPTPTTSESGPIDESESVPDGSSTDLSEQLSTNPDGMHSGFTDISPQPIDRTQPVNISWELEDAVQVTLYAMHFITKTPEPYWTPASYIEGYSVSGLSASGQIQYTIPTFFRQRSIRFRLEVERTDGSTYTVDSETIAFQTFPLFPYPDDISTYPSQTSEASYQEFENGLMIWRGDANMVFVLGHPDATGFFWKSFTGSEVSIEGNSPDALFKPEGPFSGVWHNNANVQGLGWATGPLQSYTMQWQWSLDPLYSMFDHSYMSIPDGIIQFVYLAGANESGPAWTLIE